MSEIAATVAGSFASAQADEVVVYEDAGAVEALAPAWDRLARTPMQQSIWARAWAKTFGSGFSLRISTAGPPDFPTAIVPLVENSARYELLGSDLCGSMDALGCDEDGLAAIAEELARAKAPLLLPRIPARSSFISAVRKAYGGSLVVIRGVPGAPFLALDDGWLEPERGFNLMSRSEVRRARQRAESLGEVATDILSPTVEQAGGLLDEAFRISRADPLRNAFDRLYAEAAARRGIVRVASLRLGERTAAFQLAVELGNRFWVVRQSVDESFARYSPDTLLTLETIRFAAQSGLESYELLGGRQMWTGLSPELEHEAVSVRTYSPGFSGLRALAVDGVNLAGRSWRALKDG